MAPDISAATLLPADRSDWNMDRCSMAKTLSVVGTRSALLIMREAFYGTRRFDDFVERLGIGRNILTERLRRLTEEAILNKVQYQERPARYEYRLTDKGRALFGVIAALHRWGNDWLASDDGAPVEMVDRRTGNVVNPIVVDEATGEPLDPRQLTMRRGPGFRDDLP
jgi:DNA-binding HxlR family transcriptional regulator